MSRLNAARCLSIYAHMNTSQFRINDVGP